YDFLRGFTENIYIICLLFFGTYFTIIFLVGIPFNLYFNFMVEKKYGFNNMTLKIWILDSIKELIISFVFGTILLLPLTFLLYTFPSFWFVPVWGFLIVFSLFVQIIYPTIIAPLFNKFEPLKNEELKLKIENLLKECGFESSGLFEMDASKRSSHGNAYFTGFGKSKRIVLFDTLLKRHTDEEILAVLAHELGHFKHKHILKSLVVSSAFSLIGFFLANLFIDAKIIYDTFGLDQNAKIIGLFLLSILFTPISFFTTPFGAFFSRKNEYQADAFSKEKMKDPLPLINALKKLNVDNLSSLYPHPLYAWFYYSHPPLLYRIGALNKKTKE
nr:M48 family metallopeptidase [Spirochaetota bacterium]